MDIKEEKLELIQWLAGVRDVEIIKEFMNLKKTKEVDWWDTISPEEQAEISEGIASSSTCSAGHVEAMMLRIFNPIYTKGKNCLNQDF